MKFLHEYAGEFTYGDKKHPRLIGVGRIGDDYHAASGDVRGGRGATAPSPTELPKKRSSNLCVWQSNTFVA